jgi:HEPN domain-containing protein
MKPTAELDRADDDIRLARRVVDDVDIADAIVGFHAQHAGEKAIKAVLAAREIEYAKTHALGYLIGLVETNGIDAPAAVLDASEPALDRQATLALVEEIRSWPGKSVDA